MLPTLYIELVPRTCWYYNVRSIVSTTDWNKIKKTVYTKAEYKCEVCGCIGPMWPVECHEIWHYDDKKQVQTLKGFIALCPDCHMVKHYGFTSLQGKGHIAKKHLMKVNNWTMHEADTYINKQFTIWRERSEKEWITDMQYLRTLSITIQ